MVCCWHDGCLHIFQMIFRWFLPGLKHRTLNNNGQRTLINVNRPSVVWTIWITETNIHRQVFTGQVKKTRVSDRGWFKGVCVTWWSALWQEGKTARSASLLTVLIDSETAAGLRWVIGWFFFFAPLTTKVVVAVDSPALTRKFKSLSWIFMGANKSETWVYLSACCQTVKNLGRTLLAKESDLICDQ